MITTKIMKSREDWLEERKGRIGGSEASCIVGMNPYQTNVELWEEKTGRRKRQDVSDSPFVRYGSEAEKHLRALFELDYPRYKVDYVENNLWVNDKYPFAHASLDGWLHDEDTGRNGILEIKTTSILQSMQREKWNHRIPDNYFVQVLHYLMVTEFDFAILKAQLKYDYDGDVFLTTKHYYLDRREVEEDIEYLKKAERNFYECVKNGNQPPLVLPNI